MCRFQLLVIMGSRLLVFYPFEYWKYQILSVILDVPFYLLLSSYKIEFCYYLIVPCFVDVGLIISNCYHHIIHSTLPFYIYRHCRRYCNKKAIVITSGAKYHNFPIFRRRLIAYISNCFFFLF